jgi:hypothetical protein
VTGIPRAQSGTRERVVQAHIIDFAYYYIRTAVAQARKRRTGARGATSKPSGRRGSSASRRETAVNTFTDRGWGTATPVTMPKVFQWLTFANPMRHFLEIVRGVFLKGVGFEALWIQYLLLGVMGTAVLWLAAARFRRATS